MRLRTWLVSTLVVLVLPIQAQISEMEQAYQQLAERFEVRDKNMLRDLKTYLQLYPYSTYTDEIHFMQGALQIERAYYKQGMKELEHADYKSLTRPHQIDYQFYRGYGNLCQQSYQQASVYFSNLRKKDSQYKTQATYYYGFCQYKLANYEQALAPFKELETHPEYEKTIPYYIVQIYYALHDYDEVIARAENLLVLSPDSGYASEMHRILGEIYYQQQDYKQAIIHLSKYADLVDASQQELLRNDIYLLGMASYQTHAYDKAVRYLKMVQPINDTISESAYMGLGHAYVQLGQIEPAKLSYQAAMQYGITPVIREEAMYNYALCTFQSSTALGESVKAFSDFLKEYPQSKHEDEVFALLSDALRQSRNYKAALDALDSIPKPSRKMLDTKQFLRFQLGTDAFVQGKMTQADEWLTAVIQDSLYGASYRHEAYYWRAETSYRQGNLDACRKDLNKYFPYSNQSPNRNAAKYLSGYTYFNQHAYQNAQHEFEQYIGMVRSSDPTYADAYNRIGDCHFNARDFSIAITTYNHVAQLGVAGSDYAMFQRGYALGLQHKYQDKIQSMQELVTRYPRSDYADDALYEIARARIATEDEGHAIEAYERLLDQYPTSSLARKASVERAMLYRNQHQSENAIAAYRQTIEKYPGTEEAYTALEGLEALYIELNQVNEYVNYTKQLSKLNMSVSLHEDSLRYTAHHYAAQQAYQREDYTTALNEYATLTTMVGNPYMEEACTRAAELSYDKQDFKAALTYFRKMQSVASSQEQINIARLGILRCSYNLNQPKETIEIASQMLSDELISSEIREEALYNRAKAYIATQQYTLALDDLQPICAEVRTAQGAEAKYLIAECHYNLNDLEQAEQEVMAFASMNTQQQYWLAKALILLSDINLNKGDDFQARQYLITLQNNYTQKDDILSLVQQRLEALDELNKQMETILEEEEEQ